jgi:hypothetical protein
MIESTPTLLFVTDLPHSAVIEKSNVQRKY